jgi:hypothetical protein
MPRAANVLHVFDVLREVQEPGGMRGVEETMKCKGCGREIVFLRTATGNAIPVNKETTDAVDEYFDKNRHVSHFADCPEANRFRKAEK